MYDDIVKLAEDFVEDCKEIFETDFAVFGHCTGSIIGYEILKLVEQKYNKKPIAFFASSNVAPIHSVLQSTKNVSDEEFVEGLSTYGFIDPKLFELEEFSSYYLPIIRHDFDMQEDYKCKEVFQISAPIYVYSGKNDGAITPCVAVGLSFGNIHEKSIEQIYNEMGTYFPRAAQICFGINSGRVKTKENIHLDQTPYPEELSKEIAGKCKGSKRKAAFHEYIKNPVEE